MPPRRSSRSTRASVEPETVESLPVKRKRNATADPDISEKENVGKPPSRARRSVRATVEPAAATNGRVSTRSKSTLPEVPESGDEDETDFPPPVKKARSSLEPEDLKVDESGESDIQEPLSKPKGRKVASTTKRGKPVRRAGRAGRTSRSTAVEEPAEGEEDSEDEAKPVRTNGRASTRSTVDDAMYGSGEDSKPVASGRKPKSIAKARTSRAAPKARQKHIIEDSDDSDDAEGSSVGPHTKPKTEDTEEGQDENIADNTPENGGHVEEEDEKSLFDPPPMPVPSSLPQAIIVEEPVGPSSRLVIHKMALVNFKSYAGRQEIGPFHKASPLVILLGTVYSLLSVVIFVYRRAQRFRKIQHDRRTLIRVWISCIKDEAGQVIRTYSQLCPLSRSPRLQC